MRLPVTGMTCAACQARVQRTLQKAPGVRGATVNLLMKSATVAYDPAVTSPAALVAVVEGAGYGAALPATADDAFAEQINGLTPDLLKSHTRRRFTAPSSVVLVTNPSFLRMATPTPKCSLSTIF